MGTWTVKYDGAISAAAICTALGSISGADLIPSSYANGMRIR